MIVLTIQQQTYLQLVLYWWLNVLIIKHTKPTQTIKNNGNRPVKNRASKWAKKDLSLIFMIVFHISHWNSWLGQNYYIAHLLSIGYRGWCLGYSVYKTLSNNYWFFSLITYWVKRFFLSMHSFSGFFSAYLPGLGGWAHQQFFGFFPPFSIRV